MSQQITLQRIHPVTALKFGFVLGAVLSILIALFYLILFFGAARLLSPYGNPFAAGVGSIGALLIGLALFIIFASVMYAITVWLMALIYNVVAGWSGGLQFDIVSANALSFAPQAAPAQFAPPAFSAPPNVAPPAYAPSFQDAPPPAYQPLPAPPANVNVPVGPQLLGIHNPTLRVTITKPVTTIGSAIGNDLVVASPNVAARHAEIRLEGGRYILHDLSGGQATRVLGRQIQNTNMLKDGFQVTLGDIEFMFRQ